VVFGVTNLLIVGVLRNTDPDAIAAGIGIVLLIVPGVILVTWLAVISPVIVVEGTGVMAFGRRSRRITCRPISASMAIACCR